jgi:hypothetical protein
MTASRVMISRDQLSLEVGNHFHSESDMLDCHVADQRVVESVETRYSIVASRCVVLWCECEYECAMEGQGGLFSNSTHADRCLTQTMSFKGKKSRLAQRSGKRAS